MKFGVYIEDELSGPSDNHRTVEVEVPSLVLADPLFRDDHELLIAWAWCEARDPGGSRNSPTIYDWSGEGDADNPRIWHQGGDMVFEIDDPETARHWQHLLEDLR